MLLKQKQRVWGILLVFLWRACQIVLLVQYNPIAITCCIMSCPLPLGNASSHISMLLIADHHSDYFVSILVPFPPPSLIFIGTIILPPSWTIIQIQHCMPPARYSLTNEPLLAFSVPRHKCAHEHTTEETVPRKSSLLWSLNKNIRHNCIYTNSEPYNWGLGTARSAAWKSYVATYLRT